MQQHRVVVSLRVQLTTASEIFQRSWLDHLLHLDGCDVMRHEVRDRGIRVVLCIIQLPGLALGWDRLGRYILW